MNYISSFFNIHYLPEYTFLAKGGYEQDIIAVMDPKKNIPVLISYPFQKPTLDATRILSLPFRFVKVVLPHHSLTCIPAEVYDAQYADEYCAYLLDGKTKATFTLPVKTLGMVVLYQYDLLLYNKWMNLFPDAVMIPEFILILEKIQDHVAIKGSMLSIHLKSSSESDFYLFVNGQLELINTFDTAQIVAFHYFITQLLTQYNLGDHFDKIILSGDGDLTFLKNEFLRYTDQVELLEHEDCFQLADAAKNASLKLQSTTFNTLICES